MTKHTRHVAVAVSLILTAAGCGETATPSADPFDAHEMNARFDGMNAVLDGDLWASFGMLGPQWTSTTPATAAPAASGQAGPRIPFELRGLTFVLDTETMQYVPDPDREGAPENGVRFILYAVNPITRQPDPDWEIGYTELTDDGDALESGIALRLRIVSQETTWVDYAVAASGHAGGGALDVTGFVSDPDTRVDFAIAAEHAFDDDGQAANLEFAISIPAHAFAANARVENVHSESGTAGKVTLVIALDATDLRFDAQGTPETIDAEVHVNDQLFATIRGTHPTPEIRGADGGTLSQEQLQALGHIMGMNGRTFEMFQRLMQPVRGILGDGP